MIWKLASFTLFSQIRLKMRELHYLEWSLLCNLAFHAFFSFATCVYLFYVSCKFLLPSSTNYLRKCTHLLITSSNTRQTFFCFSLLRRQKGKHICRPFSCIYFNLKAQIGSFLAGKMAVEGCVEGRRGLWGWIKKFI